MKSTSPRIKEKNKNKTIQIDINGDSEIENWNKESIYKTWTEKVRERQ